MYVKTNLRLKNHTQTAGGLLDIEGLQESFSSCWSGLEDRIKDLRFGLIELEEIM